MTQVMGTGGRGPGSGRRLYFYPERQRPGMRAIRIELGERVYTELWRERVRPKAAIRDRWLLALITATLRPYNPDPLSGGQLSWRNDLENPTA